MSYTARPQGFLAQVTTAVRAFLNEPELSQKWTDDKLWPLIVEAWSQIMDDVNGIGENPIFVRFSFTPTNQQKTLLLPGNFGAFSRIYSDETADGIGSETLVPRSRLNPWGGAVLLEGNYLRFEPFLSADTPYILEYMPSEYCPLHLGETDLSDPNASLTTVTLDTDPAEGYFDFAPGAYIGSVIRLLDSPEIDTGPGAYLDFPVQERVISDMDPETHVVTLNNPLDFDPLDGDVGAVTYEVVPFMGKSFAPAIEWRVAYQVAMIEDVEGRSGRPNRLALEYKRTMSKIRLRFANFNRRTGQRFQGDLPGNGRFGWSWGFGSAGGGAL